MTGVAPAPAATMTIFASIVPAPCSDPVVLVVDDAVVHPVAAVGGAGDVLHLVQRPDLRAVRERRRAGS